MCGITGYFSDIDQSADMQTSMSNIIHRGPDHFDFTKVSMDDGLFLGLGHARLSILDTSSFGNQPMFSDDGLIAMVFNGEIYNYETLKSLISDTEFRSSSDSEVLLKLYAKLGRAAFPLLRGMFAIAFLHLDTGQIVLVRDQIGVKPIYYSKVGAAFYFCSEIKGLKPYLRDKLSVSKEDLFDFLNCGFVYEPNTGFEQIKKVPAGAYIVVDSTGVSINRYFSLNDDKLHCENSSLDLIVSGIRDQLDSDVPVGCFFSGGIDSSVISAVSRQPGLFIGYEKSEIVESGAGDDEPYAKEIAKILNIELEVASCIYSSEVSDILKSFRFVADFSEELISDYTFQSIYELSGKARSKGFKVMLSGMGGDEVYVGYPRYKLLLHYQSYKILSILSRTSVIEKCLRRIPSLSKKIERFNSFFTSEKFVVSYSRLIGYFSSLEIERLWAGSDYDLHRSLFEKRLELLLREYGDDSLLVKALVLDYHGFLSHNLTITDKASMLHGLEVRVPLLDQDAYVNQLKRLRTEGNRVANSFGKTQLLNVLKGYVPLSLFKRKKSGFNPPLDTKIMLLGKNLVSQEIRRSDICNYINLEFVDSLIEEHFSGVKNNTYKIWQLLYLSYWIEKER